MISFQGAGFPLLFGTVVVATGQCRLNFNESPRATDEIDHSRQNLTDASPPTDTLQQTRLLFHGGPLTPLCCGWAALPSGPMHKPRLSLKVLTILPIYEIRKCQSMPTKEQKIQIRSSNHFASSENR
jgi:hypothetical protein